MNARLPDWNVVVTVYDGEFSEAIKLLSPFGNVSRTDYWNVLVMAVADVTKFSQSLAATIERDASIPNSISRIVPVTHKFQFQSPAEFEERSCVIVDKWLPLVSGKKFHVRMHRRGFKGRLSSQYEEQFLDHHLLQRLEVAGSPGVIDFDDPDVIIAVETIGQFAGLSCWTREQREQFGLLKLD